MMTKTKTNAIIKISVFGVIGLICLSILLSLLSDYSFGGIAFGKTRYYNVGNASIGDKSINSITISWVDGEVNVETYDGETVEITETGATDDDNKLRWYVSGNNLDIVFRKSALLAFNVNYEKALTVKIPNSLLTNLQRLEIETVNSFVSIKDVSATQLDIECVSQTAEILNSTFDSVLIEGVSANVNFEGNVNYFDVETVSGKINCKFLSNPQTVNIEAVSGNAEIYLNKNCGFTAIADGISNKVTTDFAVTTIDGKITFGDGLTKIYLDNVSGKLAIKQYE